LKRDIQNIQLESEKLQYIKDYLINALKPQKISLFGSRAELKVQDESDVDLLVILNASIDRGAQFKLSSKLTKKIGLYIQLIFMNQVTYEETKDIIGGIAHPATKYGVLIYENRNFKVGHC